MVIHTAWSDIASCPLSCLMAGHRPQVWGWISEFAAAQILLASGIPGEIPSLHQPRVLGAGDIRSCPLRFYPTWAVHVFHPLLSQERSQLLLGSPQEKNQGWKQEKFKAWSLPVLFLQT